MKKAIIAASLAFLAMGAAQAQNIPSVTTTKTLINACTATTSAADQAFCHGFGQGVYETYVMSRHPKRSPDFICFKEKRPKRDQVMADFIAWNAKNPQFAEKSAADTLLRYLAGAYPCKS